MSGSTVSFQPASLTAQQYYAIEPSKLGDTPSRQATIFELLAEVCPCGSKKRLSAGQRAERDWLSQRRRTSLTMRSTPFDVIQRRSTRAEGQPLRDTSRVRVPRLPDIVEQTEPNSLINSPTDTPLGGCTPNRMTAARARSLRNSALLPQLPEEQSSSEATNAAASPATEGNRSLSSSRHLASTDAVTDLPLSSTCNRQNSRSSMSRRTRRNIRMHMEQGREVVQTPKKHAAALIENVWHSLRPLFRKKSHPKLDTSVLELAAVVPRPESPHTSGPVQVTMDSMSAALTSPEQTNTQDLVTQASSVRADSHDEPGRILVSRNSTVSEQVVAGDKAKDEGEARWNSEVSSSHDPRQDAVSGQTVVATTNK